MLFSEKGGASSDSPLELTAFGVDCTGRMDWSPSCDDRAETVEDHGLFRRL